MAAIPGSLLKLFSPLNPLLTDPSVRRVLVDGPDRIYAERHGRLDRIDVTYSAEALNRALQELARRAGKTFDGQRPCLEAILKDGTRFLGLRAPVVVEGPVLCVIRPGGRTIDLDGLVRLGSLTSGAALLLERAMQIGLNLVVCGPAGAGRTTMMEALASAEPPDTRMALLEEFAELRLPGRRVLRMIPHRSERGGASSVSLGDLLYCAGRMTVRRVLITEVRRVDAWDTLALLAARSSPVLLTLPGLTAADALARFEGLARASASGSRERAASGLVAAGLDLMVAVTRRGNRYRVSGIDAVWADGGNWRLEPLFVPDGRTGGSLVATAFVAESASRWGLVTDTRELEAIQGVGSSMTASQARLAVPDQAEAPDRSLVDFEEVDHALEGTQVSRELGGSKPNPTPEFSPMPSAATVITEMRPLEDGSINVTPELGPGARPLRRAPNDSTGQPADGGTLASKSADSEVGSTIPVQPALKNGTEPGVGGSPAPMSVDASESGGETLMTDPVTSDPASEGEPGEPSGEMISERTFSEVLRTIGANQDESVGSVSWSASDMGASAADSETARPSTGNGGQQPAADPPDGRPSLRGDRETVVCSEDD